MKPKEYLEQLENDKPRAIDNLDFAYKQGLYDGAQRMWELMRAKQKKYRNEHRDEIRAYNTQYQRERRARLKAMKEDIDKISTMN